MQGQSTASFQIIKSRIFMTTFANKTLIFSVSVKHGLVKMILLPKVNFAHLGLIFCVPLKNCRGGGVAIVL